MVRGSLGGFLAELEGCQALLEGARVLRKRWALPVAAALALATVAAYALHPRFELALGTGLADPLLHRFGSYDRGDEGVLFRRPFPGAFIDLRDFGAASPWTVSIEAFDRSRRLELPAPPWGIESGHVLPFSESDGRVASVSRHTFGMTMSIGLGSRLKTCCSWTPPPFWGAKLN